MPLPYSLASNAAQSASQNSWNQQTTQTHGSLALTDCWLVHATGKHSKLGTSTLDFYFHPQYGFTEMKYRFYDGTSISFVLEQATQ